jgi:mono/diheme cytochrome c family protein
VNIEAKALIAALLISGTVIGAFLGTGRTVQSNTSMLSGKSAAQSRVAKDPKVAAGAKLFALNCAHCHGIDATGGEGPDLHMVAKNDERIKSTILNGVKGEMPAFRKKLTGDDAAALVTFIRSLSSARLERGLLAELFFYLGQRPDPLAQLNRQATPREIAPRLAKLPRRWPRSDAKEY